MSRRSTIPSYRLHKQSGQAVVTLTDWVTRRRRDVLLGVHGSPASRGEYARVLAEWEGAARRLPAAEAEAPADLTVSEVALAFLNHADVHYSAEGREAEQFRLAIRPLRELYGHSPAARFGPKALKTVREAMVHGGLCRNVVNRRITRVKTLFKWAVEQELLRGDVYAALRAVRALPPNAPGVRHTAPVAPAFWDHIEAAIPFCPPPVAAMLRLQWLAGMRSGEVRRMRTCDVDRADPAAWIYRPGSDAGAHGAHKNAWRGQDRVVSLGPKCVEVLTPWLRPEDPAAFLFSPARAEAGAAPPVEATSRPASRVSDAGRDRRDGGRRWDAAARMSYPQAVKRACEKAGVAFHPYMLRHGRKMVVERAAGSDAARAVLGQKSIDSTTHYGSLDVETAKAVMEKMG